MSPPTPWTIDPDFDSIDLDPSDFQKSVPLKKVPTGDIFSASRAGDIERLKYLLETGLNVNARDQWDSVALYYACLAGHLEAAKMLLESGAICSEHTFDGDRCHYAALNLKVRKLLKAFEARPPPLGALQGALRDTFLGCRANGEANFGLSLNVESNSSHFPPDVTFIVHGKPIEAHRIILSARSSFFKKKFETEWRGRRQVRLPRERLSYPALFSLIHFFYSDRLDIAVDDMEDLVKICKVCKCEALQEVLQKELIHQKYADYKSLRDIDNSQKRFILQGLALPEQDRLPAALYQILQVSLSMSSSGEDLDNLNTLVSGMGRVQMTESDDLADICIRVGKKIFRCHQVILASRSEYFRARLSRMSDFLEGKNDSSHHTLPILEEHDLSTEAFEKMIEYMYTDGLKDVDSKMGSELGRFFLVVLAVLIRGGFAQPLVPAIITFGDSVVDIGNNDYLHTIFKANYPPYGRDFSGRKATGRFCNGKLATDLTADTLGFTTYPPAYLSPQASGKNLLIGANFASAASGYYDHTAITYHAITLTQQLAYYKEYQGKLAKVAGSAKAASIIKEALYLVSFGSSDFVQNYYINPLLNKAYTPDAFSAFLVSIFSKFVKDLYGSGARKIGVTSLPPMGCLPAAITLFGFGKKGCVANLNRDAQGFNVKINSAATQLKKQLPGLKIVIFDIYKPLFDVVKNPSKNGFTEASKGCCGTGTVETTSLLCNPKSIGTCSNASTYVFWDSVHPSQAANQILADSLLLDGISLIG